MERVVIRYSLRYSLLKILGNLVFVILGIYLIKKVFAKQSEGFSSSDYFLLIFSGIFILYYGKKIIFEFFSFNKKIVFSKEGIEYKGILHHWADICEKKIFSKKERTPKYRVEYEEFYLSFRCKNETIEIKIDDFNTSEKEIKALLEKYTTGYM